MGEITGNKEPATNICGFSMGAPELRECIKGRCTFWTGTDKLIEELKEEAKTLGYDQGYLETEIEEFQKEAGDGFCCFRNL